ncbi:acyl carrier protein [Burkholderia cepacia]|uniref:acyl carrier protein n=1 Tax=Burkholderia cepacia TaxID=292 RepID=UPI0038BB541B
MNRKQIIFDVVLQVSSENTHIDTHVRIAPESLLYQDLGLDSLKMVEVFVELERKLGVTMDESLILDLTTFHDLLSAFGEN